MLFENLKVSRVVDHEIFRRNEDKSIRAPIFADALETLGAEALLAFRLRMTDALSGQSQSIQMSIARHNAGSFLELAEDLIGSTEEAFLAGSKEITTKLVDAQMARGIPGGMLVVFDGTVGTPAFPFIGAIKAETQAGFRRSKDGEKSIVEFLQNIFLTPATRLYKIGMMLFDDRTKTKPEGRRAFVFDSNISVSNREAAATYFYEGFLGCVLPSDGPYETAKFFDLTKEFIRKSALDPDKKRNIIDSLHVFVRDEQTPTFTADQFGSRYIPEEMQDTFADFLSSRRFTSNAVVRDTSQMGTRLRRRRLKFGNDIELSATPEALKNKVLIEAIEGQCEGGQIPRWTRITLREALTGEQ
jgi:hypothetical protein